MSYGMAPSRSATARTSFAGTNRSSGFGSMKRMISHGQAIRSTRARSRVIHFMLVLLSHREDDQTRQRPRGDEHRLRDLEAPRDHEGRAAMSSVGTSTIARRASTTQAPAIVPDAAAVTPATKPLTLAFPLIRSNHGNGTTTNRYTGRNTPTAAATAPGKAATR